MNVLQALKEKRNIKKAAAMASQSAKQKSKVNMIPYIALGVANVLVISLDYRVVEAVYKLTDNVILAVFALLTSGMMFILWFDILYQYLLASDWQKYISLAFSGLSLISAGVFAFLDYGLSAGFGADKVLPTEANYLFAGMVILTILNCAGLFWWYIIDAQIVRKSNSAKQEADSDYDAQNVEIANNLLENVDRMLTRRQHLEAKFGAAAVDQMLATLSGLEDALGIDIDGDGKIGSGQQMRSFPSIVEELPTVLTDPKAPASTLPKPK